MISEVQERPERQHRVFDRTIRTLKWTFPYFPGKTEDSASVKNILVGEGNWTYVKEVLGWMVDMEAGAIALPEQKLWKLLALLAILATQYRIGRK